jgi:hypothetical protein
MRILVCAWLLPLPVCIALLSIAANAARIRDSALTERTEEALRRLPTRDYALFGSSRWLRGASLEEPGAAFADGPGIPDSDPAGGFIAPPRALWLRATASPSVP